MCCLYTSLRVSLSCPNVVLVSALSALSLGLHLVIRFLMCGANDMDVLYVTPSIFVSCVCGIKVLFNVAVGLC